MSYYIHEFKYHLLVSTTIKELSSSLPKSFDSLCFVFDLVCNLIWPSQIAKLLQSLIKILHLVSSSFISKNLSYSLKPPSHSPNPFQKLHHGPSQNSQTNVDFSTPLDIHTIDGLHPWTKRLFDCVRILRMVPAKRII